MSRGYSEPHVGGNHIGDEQHKHLRARLGALVLEAEPRTDQAGRLVEQDDVLPALDIVGRHGLEHDRVDMADHGLGFGVAVNPFGCRHAADGGGQSPVGDDALFADEQPP